MNYSKLKKDELLVLVKELKELSDLQLNELESLKKDINSTNRKYNIATTARKEDKDKVEQAEKSLIELESSIKKIKSLEEELEVVNRKYNIATIARKEDKDKVEQAEKSLIEHKRQEEELIKFYNSQLSQMNKMVNEQNETIINLFDMIDSTISLQVKYYQKYKDIFIRQEEPINKDKKGD